MGIILGALAGAGDYIAKSETENQKRMDSMELENHRSDLEMRKLKMLDSLKERSAIATEQRGEEPLKRFGAALTANQQGEVPVTAAPVTSLAGKQGQNTDGNALVSGFTGGLEKIKADIMAMPEGIDKTQAIAQLQGQYAAETETANKAIIGQTRKITSDEALNKTLSETLGSDPVALAAYEKSLGQPARADRKIDVTEKQTEARAVASVRDSERKTQADANRYELEMKKLGQLAGAQQSTAEMGNRKIDAWIENEAAKRDNDATKAENAATGKAQSPERLYSIVNAMNTTIKNLDDGNKGKTTEEKAEWQRQKDTAVRVRDRASGLLDTTLSDRGAPESTVKQPAPTKQAAPASTRPITTGLATPKTQAEFNAIPSGTDYVNPSDGKTYRKK